MGGKKTGAGKVAGKAAAPKDLRMRAEEKVRAREHFDLGEPPPGQTRGMYNMLHELRVHETELEMQNEQLRLTQEELEAARAKYYDLFNFAPAGYFTMNGDGLVLEANFTAINLLGMDLRKVVNQPFTRLVAAADQDIYYLSRKKLLKTDKPQSCELRMKRADGSRFWARVELLVPRGVENGGAASFAMVSDISGSREAQAKLQRSEDELLDLYNNAPCGYHSLNRDGVFVRINDTELRWLRYTREEVVGKMKAADVLTAESIETFRRNFPRFLATGSVKDLYFVLKRKDGSTFPVILSSTGIRNERGEVVMTRSTMFDITRLREAEEKLEASERTLSKAQKIARLGSWEMDIRTGKMTWSDELFSIFGFEPGSFEPTFEVFIGLVRREDRKKIRDYYSGIMKGEGVPIEHDLRIVRPDGREKVVYDKLELIKNANGRPLKLVGIDYDVTDRKMERDFVMKMMLEFQEKERARVAAELHDSLAQNMLVVSNEIKLALKALPAGSPVAETLAGSSDLALRTIHEILEIAYGLRPSHLDQLGFKNAVDSMARRVAGSLEINIHSEIRLEGEKLTPEMEINVFRIIQEALNNIIKHSGARNAFIDVSVSNRSLVLSVSDDGRGYKAQKRRGFGLVEMMERATVLNGQCEIKSGAGGTAISVVIPLPHREKGKRGPKRVKK